MEEEIIEKIKCIVKEVKEIYTKFLTEFNT